MRQSLGHEVAEEVLIALRRIIRAIDLHSRALVDRFGLTGPQLVVLKRLHAEGRQPIGRLAEAVSLSSATLTGIIERLEKAGLSCRVRSDEDRRRVMVSLTEKGEQVLARTPPLLQDHFIDQFARLESWEQTQILSVLQRIVSMMEAKELEARPILATGPLDVSPDETRDYLETGDGLFQASPADQTTGSSGGATAAPASDS